MNQSCISNKIILLARAGKTGFRARPGLAHIEAGLYRVRPKNPD